LSSSDTTSALRLAAHLAVATAYRTCIEGATVRNVYVGMAAQSGIRAAQLARAGFTGLDDAASEVFGKVLGDAFDTRVLTDELGTRFEITRGFFKLYACCQWNHATLEALEEVLASVPSVDSDVEAIQVRTFFPATTMAAPEPVSSLQAKFSLPYAVAARIAFGHAGPDAFRRESLRDPRVLALARRVEVIEEASFTDGFPKDRSAEVVLKTTSGVEHRALCHNARGDFVRPHPRAALEEKYQQLAGRVLGAEAIAELARVVNRLDQVVAASELIQAMRTQEGIACPA
jgi:2-methylcitrate dehydratase PrpD